MAPKTIHGGETIVETTELDEARAGMLALRATAAAALVPELTAGEEQLTQYLDELQVWLDTAFVSPRAAARKAAVFTIERATQRDMPKMGADPGVLVSKVLYLATMQTPLEYTNNAEETVAVAAGARVVFALQSYPLRDDVYAHVTAAIANGGIVPNMMFVFGKHSAASKAKGFGPPVVLTSARIAMRALPA